MLPEKFALNENLKQKSKQKMEISLQKPSKEETADEAIVKDLKMQLPSPEVQTKLEIFLLNTARQITYFTKA